MRSFVAIDIPDALRERIAAASSAFSSEGLTMVKGDALHITLQFLGELNNAKLAAAKEAVEDFDQKKFEVDLSGVSYFTADDGTIRVIFVKVGKGYEELKGIYAAISANLARKGIRFINEKDYVPHVTIARVKRCKNKAQLIEMIRTHSDINFGSFTADSISLKQSTLTLNGPIYSDLYKKQL